MKGQRCGKRNILTVYLCLRIQREKLLSALIPVDLVELVRLPGILHTQRNQFHRLKLRYLLIQMHFYLCDTF